MESEMECSKVCLNEYRNGKIIYPVFILDDNTRDVLDYTRYYFDFYDYGVYSDSEYCDSNDCEDTIITSKIVTENNIQAFKHRSNMYGLITLISTKLSNSKSYVNLLKYLIENLLIVSILELDIDKPPSISSRVIKI